jgi:uncharacterized membrane protein (UPF0127 family)
MNKVIFKNSISFPCQVAVSAEEQAAGLMHKLYPQVMAFPYQTKEARVFWMKNTYSPLDIIFSSEGKITSIAYGEPLSEEKIISEPCDLVVEVPAGTAQELGLRPGDSVRLRLNLATLAEKFASGSVK